MIDPKLLKEITDAHSNAQLGYGAVNHPTYVKHVGALLREREGLIAGCEVAADQVQTLTEECQKLRGELAAANVRIVELEAVAPAVIGE